MAHRRHQGAAGRPRDGVDRQPAADLHRSGHGCVQRAAEHAPPAPCTRRASPTRRCRTPTPATTSRPIPEIGLARRRVPGQRHPARHLRPGEPGAARRRLRPELLLLALGDDQQRRHQGDLHRRVGWRHDRPLPGDGPARVGRRRDLRHRRRSDGVPQLLQDAGACRRPRRTASPTTAPCSPSRAATSSSRRGTRAACRSSTSPTPAARRRSPSSTGARSTPPTPTGLNLGGLWSTYWYNGHVYGTEIARGFDTFGLLASDQLSRERDRRRVRGAGRRVQRRSTRREIVWEPELRRRRRPLRPGGPRRRPRRQARQARSPRTSRRPRSWSTSGERRRRGRRPSSKRDRSAIDCRPPLSATLLDYADSLRG